MSHYWRDGEGNDTPLEDLDDNHLANILRMYDKKRDKPAICIHLMQEARSRQLVWRK